MDAVEVVGRRAVEEVFNDFIGRRAGLIKALTTDVAEFCQQCDPEKENLCLYGQLDGKWEVSLPVDDVPPELPEPALGINFARDGMKQEDWLSLVAIHSDSWLLAVAFYFCARFGLGKNERNKIFQMINDLPTIFEVVKGQSIDDSAAQNSGSKRKSSGTMLQKQEHQAKGNRMSSSPSPKEYESEEEREEDNEQEGATLCGLCSRSYDVDEFWICCDVCQEWFHGKCVRMTAAKAQNVKQYKCPKCNPKRLKL